MRILAPLAALAALTFAQAAAAATVTIAPVAFAAEFQPTLEEKIGPREGEYLQRAAAESVAVALERAGAQVGPGGEVTVEVTIVDADPNRPTFLELRDEPSLDLGRSISIGGAELHAVLRGADGAVITEVGHDYYSSNLANSIGAGTWTDARRAMRRFADRVADAYVASGR